MASHGESDASLFLLAKRVEVSHDIVHQTPIVCREPSSRYAILRGTRYRIVTKTSDQTGTQDQAKATIDERDYTGITHRRRATNVAQRKSLKNEWARLDSN